MIAAAPARGATEPIVELREVRRFFGHGENMVRALDGIDLDVHEGDFLAVMGASGSGKSTCMNIVGCLDRPTAGTYRFGGVDVGALSSDQLALLRRHGIGFVFQGFNLLPRTTAAENVELPLVYQRVPARERRRRALETLDQVGLSARARHMPSELSGGQQQRVAIARALVTRPRLLVADEPTGNLDSATSVEVMEMLVGLNLDLGLTIVMVTHEEDMAAFAGRIVVFTDGRIVRDSLTGGPAGAR
jgi:putative ABC transport system ATP-binding protein